MLSERMNIGISYPRVSKNGCQVIAECFSAKSVSSSIFHRYVRPDLCLLCVVHFHMVRFLTSTVFIRNEGSIKTQTFHTIDMSSLIGQTLDHYRVIERIGQGGMATVYLAVDTQSQEELALKIASQPPLSVEITKRMVWVSRFDELIRAVDLETWGTAICSKSEDHKASVAAFLGKQPTPKYTGR